MLPMLSYNVAALMIAVIYYSWRDLYHSKRLRDERIQRERVAYMLWVAADRCA